MGIAQTDNLPNKPLVEAIFELRWQLEPNETGSLVDPRYSLLVGLLYDAMSKVYPIHKQLQAASIPDEMAAYIVQHQFLDNNGWPLIQIGPGIITLNDTKAYSWVDFQSRIHNLIEVLFKKYPNASEKLRLKSASLRYIDAEEFDFGSNNIWDFLSDKLKWKVTPYAELFGNTGVNSSPMAFDLKFTFPSTDPVGAAFLRFARGGVNDVEALVWETQVQSSESDVPGSQNALIQWVNKAHDLTHDWFYKMIDGDLMEKYK